MRPAREEDLDRIHQVIVLGPLGVGIVDPPEPNLGPDWRMVRELRPIGVAGDHLVWAGEASVTLEARDRLWLERRNRVEREAAEKERRRQQRGAAVAERLFREALPDADDGVIRDLVEHWPWLEPTPIGATTRQRRAYTWKHVRRVVQHIKQRYDAHPPFPEWSAYSRFIAQVIDDLLRKEAEG